MLVDAPFGSRPWREDIDPCPDLGWRPAPQMVVRTIVVVPDAHIPQGVGEITPIRNRLRRQRPFHRANEPLDTPVLPRTTRLCPLMADPQEPEAPSEQP